MTSGSMAPHYLAYQALCSLCLMSFEGILPYEYRIITTAIAGLGCMLTSVSAFMLSTMFRNKDQKTQKFLIALCLLCLMSSLMLLVAATTLWIFLDGWSIESVGLLTVSLIFMLTPMIMYVGRRLGPCQRVWSNTWLPILVAMFVHITIITTIILIMKKYEYSEEGCASEWPLIHKLFGAVASPFVLCLLVFGYKKPELLAEQKPSRLQTEIATTITSASTAGAVMPITAASDTVSTSITTASTWSITSSSATRAMFTDIIDPSAITSLPNCINVTPSTDSIPINITASPTPTTSSITSNIPKNTSADTTLTTAVTTTNPVTPIKVTPTTLATTRPTNTLTMAVTPTIMTPTTSGYSAGPYPVKSTHDKLVQLSISTPVVVAQQEDEAFAGTSGWPRRRWRVPVSDVNTASQQDLLALMFHDKFSRVQQVENMNVGGLFRDIQSAMAEMQSSFHSDLHNVHGCMQADIVDLESKIQTGFTGLQCVLQSGIAEHLTAVRTGLGNIQDVLYRGLSDIRETVHNGLTQGDSSIQKVHTTVLEGLTQISEEADSVVSLLTEVVDNQSSAQFNRTEAFETPGDLREQEVNPETNEDVASIEPGFIKRSSGRPAHTTSARNIAITKEPLVSTRRSLRKKKWKGRKYK
ncbi:uncharacterized protein LOC122541397 [Chiloscyllium plagiosum]|uniref:uncharacterized protein LOC122541397 n=1 Tax=Chiloscyllium plagiosum TaxID=36176 RepID=UPI001CB84701|nr:uncharacterized protein LOC122541397 [Chiloscyllium plagiosum]